MSSTTGPAPSPKVEHFQVCTDQALGGYVRSRAAYLGGDEVGALALGLLAYDAAVGELPDEVDQFRQGCQCASLRASAAATYQGKLRKAAAAKGGQ